MRRPRVLPPPPAAALPLKAPLLVQLPQPPDHRVLVARILAAPSPDWVDLPSRRHWLETKAEVYRTEAGKTVAICEAARTIGFEFE